MSRLSDTGAGEEKKDADLPRRYVSMIVASGTLLALVVLAVLAAAVIYTLSTSGGLPAGVVPDTSTTSSTVTSTTTPTTSTTTSTTTTSTTSTTSTTATTASTSSTFSQYQIAACMADRADVIYLSDNIPSKNLELYLDDYSVMFRIEECKSDEELDACNSQINAEYLEDGQFYYNNDLATRVGYYPVVVRGANAYVVPTPKAFEDLLMCGSIG